MSTLILAISGGPDSVYLLYKLLKKGQHPILAHFNHKLRNKESDADEIFVKKLTQQHHLTCETESADVKKWAKIHKKSLEEAGRILRYEFLERVRQKHNAKTILTAHTLNDNLETVLLNKARGCGLKGLIGMQSKNGFLHRPLLNTHKKTILAFLDREKIPYRIDASNKDITFTRNRIRLVTIPKLLKKNPHLFKDFQNERRQALQQYKALQKETISWLNTHEALAKCAPPDFSPAFSFSTQSFLKLPQEKRHFLLHYLYEHFYKSTYNLSRTLILEIEKLIQNDRTGKTKKFGPEVKVETAYHQVHFKILGGKQGKNVTLRPLNRHEAKRSVLPPAFSPCDLKKKPISKVMVRADTTRGAKRSALFFPEFLHEVSVPAFSSPHHDKLHLLDLNLSLIPNNCIKIRSFKPGDRFQPSGMKGTKKLQDFFTDLKIPREKRHTIPVYTTQNDVIIAVGTRLDERFRVTPPLSKML